MSVLNKNQLRVKSKHMVNLTQYNTRLYKIFKKLAHNTDIIKLSESTRVNSLVFEMVLSRNVNATTDVYLTAVEAITKYLLKTKNK